MNKKHDYNDEMQDLIFTSAGDFRNARRTTPVLTTKGLGWAFLIIDFIVGVPILMLMASVGLEEYGRYCNLNIMPCFGLNK